jgi:hypothetical protein
MIVQKEENSNLNNSENERFNNNININNDINNINNNNPNFQNINFENFNEIYNHISAIDNNYDRNMGRGFNIFLSHGVGIIELRMMRLLFHLSLHQQSLQRGFQLDWSEEGMFRREERWLINQLHNSSLNNNNSNENEPQERDNEREIIINRSNGNNYNYISLNINESANINDILRRRIIENINFEFEPNYYFLIGFCVGFITNFFGLLLLICRFKPRFKIGLIFGTLFSMFFFFMTIFAGK